MPALVLLTLAGGALRFATLDLQSFWYDEAATAELLELSLPDMLGRIPERESTPPLFYVLAWLWTRQFDTGEAGLRALSALAGTATIPALQLAARELTGSRRAALAAAALAAFNPLLVWYSQEARAYALLALLSALSLAFFARSLRTPGPAPLAAWAAAAVLALATHYFAAFLIVPQAVWLLVALPRRAAVPAVGAPLLAAAGLAPIALEQRSLDLAAFIRDTSIGVRLARLPKQLAVGFDAPLELLLSAAGIALLALGVVLALRRPAAPGVLAAVALAGLAVGLPLALALAGADYFETRNLLPALPALLVAAGAGFARARAGAAGVAALCAIGLTAVAGVALEPRWQREDWRGVAGALGPAPGARAIVLSSPASGQRPLRLYRPGIGELGAAGASVRELALVAVVGGVEGGGGKQAPPPLPGPELTPPGFRTLRSVRTRSYTVVVLEADGPRLVTPDLLYRLRLRPGPAAVLLQRPAGAAARARRPRAA